MPTVLGKPVYYKLEDLKKGTPLVKHGEYVGATQGKMGTNYNFVEIDGETRHVILSGGVLGWRISNNDFQEGSVLDINYDGQEKIEKGKWAGKMSHQFEIAIYKRSEVAELVAAGAELRNELPEVAEIADTRMDAASESLDDLA